MVGAFLSRTEPGAVWLTTLSAPTLHISNSKVGCRMNPRRRYDHQLDESLLAAGRVSAAVYAP